MIVAETEYGSAQLICEVGRKLQGGIFRQEITREAYLRDLVYAEDLRFSVHEWAGEDRDGKPLVISWVAYADGRLLSAYEIQGKA